MQYVRTVKTASGATAVQIVYSSRRGSREIEHIGSAHDDGEPELAQGRQRLGAGQGVLNLALGFGGGAGRPLPITYSRMGHLPDALARGYDVLDSGGPPAGTRYSARWLQQWYPLRFS